MTEQLYPSAQVSPKSRFSLIWIIPIIAALIAGWLAFRYYSERGTMITITFDSASGIEAKKTPIRFKDVQVGKVKKISLTNDLEKVVVNAEIFPEMAANLGAETRFWIEKPRVSFKGVSGLDTLLSGVHISLDPGVKGEILENYEGLAKPPVITSSEQGTSIILNTKSLGSLDIGSPVYFHKINVGEVISYKLNDDDKSIDVSIYVRAPYDAKIKTNTRFWNASGLELNLTTAGVSARMESLTSLLIGGVAFETPDDKFGLPLSGLVAFKLYNNYQLAQDDTQRLNKLFYVMYFDDSLHGLDSNSVIEYNGVKVGKVESILLETNPDSTRVKTLVKVSLRIDKFSQIGNKEDAEKTLQGLVSDGLRAQLAVNSLLTGSQLISLNMIDNIAHDTASKSSEARLYTLMPTTSKHSALFPTTASKTSLLNFDASKISQELSKTLASVNTLINSKDIKKTLQGLASTSKNIDKITRQLAKKGVSGEIVKTLSESRKAIKDISALMGDTRKTMVSITRATNSLQKDVSLSMKTFNNVSNKLQRDTSRTLGVINKTTATLDKSLKTTLSEDSALQYRLQQLINNLSEASQSFSVLADTIQRKPNSVIIGK